MDAVAAPHHHRVPVLAGAPLDHVEQLRQRLAQHVARGLDLQREGGVEQIAAGHALMHVTRGGPDVLGEVGEEGDDVVLDGLLDLQHARRPRSGPLARISRAAAVGISPRSARTSQTTVSISCQCRKRTSSDQIAFISRVS